MNWSPFMDPFHTGDSQFIKEYHWQISVKDADSLLPLLPWNKIEMDLVVINETSKEVLYSIFLLASLTLY